MTLDRSLFLIGIQIRGCPHVLKELSHSFSTAFYALLGLILLHVMIHGGDYIGFVVLKLG